MESSDQPNQPTPAVWQLVVRKAFNVSGVSEFAFWLSNNVLDYLIGEHPSDDEVKTTHCHILIQGLKVTDEGLRKSLKRCDISGAEYSLMKSTKAKPGQPRKPYNLDKLAIYIIKGDKEQVKSSSFMPAQIDTWEKAWIEYEPAERSEAEQGGLNELSKSPTAKKPNTIYQDCDEIIDTIPEWNQRKPNLVERTQVVAAIIAWANNKRKALHSVQVMNYYDIILQNAVPEYYKTLCVDLINRRHR